MAATLDHLLWASRDLDAAVEALHARSGVRAAPGGRHPELGTWNALARLGDRIFLELVAPDPTLERGSFARWLGALPEPALVMWAARTSNAKATADLAREAGYAVEVLDGRRERPDGRVLTWTNVFVTGHGAGTLVPFFIEWGDTEHPAASAPAGLTLDSFTIETPQPASLRAVLDALAVKVAVRKGARDRLCATIMGPRGEFVLTGPDTSAATS